MAGTAIGSYMDHQAAALKTSLPEATVKQQRGKVYVTFPAGILFDKGKDQLSPSVQEPLTRAAYTLKDSETNIIVGGHTDTSGNDSINLPLSQRRADRVREFSQPGDPTYPSSLHRLRFQPPGRP